MRRQRPQTRRQKIKIELFSDLISQLVSVESAKKCLSWDFNLSVQEVDHNLSGTVDFEEFLSLVEKKISRIKRDEQIIKLFRVFDRDQNGYITPAELR